MSGMPGESDRAAPPGAIWFALQLLVLSILLLFQIETETKFDAMWKVLEKGDIFNRGKLFAQPAFWPTVGLIGMIAFGFGHAVHMLIARWGKKGGFWEAIFWLRPNEYLLYFMIYVLLVREIGYLPATLFFCVSLALRVGYRSLRGLLAAVLTGLAVVLVFKTGLSVKIPGGAVYEYLPNTLRTFAIVNF